jgi:hypothetical protein
LAKEVAKVHVKCRVGILALLEKDLGDRFVYCSACCQLHLFSPSWPILECNRFRYYKAWAFDPNWRGYPYKLYALYIYIRGFAPSNCGHLTGITSLHGLL